MNSFEAGLATAEKKRRVLRGGTVEQKWPDDPMLIPLSNGLFDINTQTFTDFLPDPATDRFIPVEYHPDADPRPMHQFLNELGLTVENQKLLQMMFGYCLLRDCRFEKAFFLYGTGKGKSTIIQILHDLLGIENTSLVPFEGLSNIFHRGGLHNHLVNFDFEESCTTQVSPRDSMYFKTIVSGAAITGTRKYQDQFTFYPFCKMIGYGINKPSLSTAGLQARFVFIEFPGDIPRERIKPNISQKLLRDHASAILSYALQGLSMLLDEDGFKS